ncbi:MAG: acetyl-CoA carboxylase biotin carboxyl carrier protein subunit [Bacteroidetes bacterium 4572_112]|nr:MAG: acetyl-CoA carboxylase biotin carboxyl carrier protein subunit [Bacteroidetes bacterium 4572_112]
MKNFSFKIRGHKYDVDVYNQDGKTIDLEINGSKYHIELEHEIKTKKTPTLVRQAVKTNKSIQQNVTSGPHKVQCPLPGNIVALHVKEGDTVKVGDKLFVYEAMKMENVLEAEKAGTVAKVLANVGDAVLQDQVIIEINL